MKLFGIEEAPDGVALHLPSGRTVNVALAHNYAGAQALGRHILAALRSPSEPNAVAGAPRGPGPWPEAAHHLRESAVEVLQPQQGETLANYVERIQESTPSVLFRTFQRMVGQKVGS